MSTEPSKPRPSSRAKQIYEKLMLAPRPVGFSNNEWAKSAGVNTSFFTNLRNGSEPSVSNLAAVLSVIGTNLPEFFLQESEGSLVRLPSERELKTALLEAMPDMPRSPERRASYLAAVVIRILELQSTLDSNPSDVPSASADAS